MKNNEWFKLKRYPHIGLPITQADKAWVINYVKNQKKIEKHSFLPFIHKSIYSKKYRKEYDIDGNLLNQGRRAFLKPKIRDIYYASHLDSNIYSYYASLISNEYEKSVRKKGLQEVITAYRKIPFNPRDPNSRNKCNIDFADDVFNYIRDNSVKDLVAITFDIKGFFDNLNHQKLKQAWCDILGVNRLEKDHYNVFKNITKFSYVEEQFLFNLFQNEIIVQTPSGKTKNKRIQDIDFLYNQNAIAFCGNKEISKIRAKGLIHSNKRDEKGRLRDFGICQGSSISAVLANIYMLNFDESANKLAEQCNGIYRRYSDDMVVVCESKFEQKIIDFFEVQLPKMTLLEIQTRKTQIFNFYYQGMSKRGIKRICAQKFNGKINQNSFNRNFEYLGFYFDGEYTYIKPSTTRCAL